MGASTVASVINARLEALSGHECGTCDETNEFKLGCDLFYLHVHRIYANEEGVYLYDVLNSEGSDFKYAPYFLCTDCWEEAQESLAATVQGTDAVVAHPHLRQCDVCMSSILSGELIGLVEYGALHLDERQPEGAAKTVRFLSHGEPYYICTYCLDQLNVEVMTYWDEDVRNGNECQEGLEERCWRTGECQNVCKHEMAHQWASEHTT